MNKKILSRISQLSKDIKGATMIEFALVVGLLLLTILFIVDLSRYYAVKTVLIKGAQEGLNNATKAAFIDNDIRDISLVTVEQYKTFHNARKLVVTRALALPRNSGLISDSKTIGAGAYLQQLDMLQPDGTYDSNDAALIRPGEQIIVNATSEIIDHPTLCAETSSCVSKINDVANYKNLLDSHPLVVEMRAQMITYTPFFPNLTVIGRAVGFREQFGKLPTPVTFPPNPDSDPDPDPAPIPDCDPLMCPVGVNCCGQE